MIIIGTVRGSSWGKFYDCTLSWYYSNIVGLRSPSAGAACMGTAIHAGTALFDNARLNGVPVEVAEAVEEAIAYLHEPNEEVDWQDVSEFKEAELTTIKLVTKYCLEVAPTREYLAVELTCEPLDIETRYGAIRTTGQIDRIRVTPTGQIGNSDLKSGKRATTMKDGVRVATTIGHHMQLGIYTLMAEASSHTLMTAPAEIIGLQTTSEAHIATAEMPDVKTALLGTDNQPGMIEMSAKMLKEGLFPPNPKSVTCSKRYCDGWHRCPYKNQ